MYKMSKSYPKNYHYVSNVSGFEGQAIYMGRPSLTPAQRKASDEALKYARALTKLEKEEKHRRRKKKKPVVVANGYGEYEIYTPLPRKSRKTKVSNKNKNINNPKKV